MCLRNRLCCSTTADFMGPGFEREWTRSALVGAVQKWRQGNQKDEDLVVDIEKMLKLFFDYWDDMLEWDGQL